MAQTFARSYERPELGLRFPYPSDWSIEDSSRGFTLTAPDMSSVIIFSIGILDLEEVEGDVNPNSDIDAREFILGLLENADRDYQILDEGSTSINGRDFYSILFIPENQDQRELFMVTGAIEGTIYIFRQVSNSEQTYSQTLPIFQQMITSAELTGANPDLLEQEDGEEEGEEGEQFNPFGQGGTSPGGQGVQQGQQQGGGQGVLDGGGGGSQAVPAQTTRIYENRLYNLKVPYPSSWTVDDTVDREVIFAPQVGKTPEISIISIPTSSYDPERFKFVADGLKQDMMNKGATIADENQYTINGRDVSFFSYTWTDPASGSIYKYATFVTGTNDFMYTFQLTADPIDEFDNLFSVLNSMVQGAEFSESGTATPQSNSSPGGLETSNNTLQGTQGLGQTPQDGGFGSQSQDGAQTQGFDVPVLINVIGPTNLNSNGNACINTELTVSGEQRNFCNDFEIGPNGRSSGQFQLQINLTNWDEGLIQYVNVEVCITLTLSNAQPIEECNAAVYDRNQAAYIANIDFTVGGQSGQVQQGPGFGENNPPSGQGQPTVDFIN